jgi:hypothetical protein
MERPVHWAPKERRKLDAPRAQLIPAPGMPEWFRDRPAKLPSQAALPEARDRRAQTFPVRVERKTFRRPRESSKGQPTDRFSMDQSLSHREPWPTTRQLSVEQAFRATLRQRVQVSLEAQPDQLRSAELLVATKARQERREGNTSPSPGEATALPPKVHLFLRQGSGMAKPVTPAEPLLWAEVQAQSRRQAKRQSPGSPLHSRARRASMKASQERRARTVHWALPEMTEPRAAGRAPRPRAERRQGRLPSRARPAAKRPQEIARAAPRRTRWRVSRSRQDPVMRQKRRTSPDIFVRAASGREFLRQPVCPPLLAHLYSWYWSTFTFSSTAMASSVRAASEQ